MTLAALAPLLIYIWPPAGGNKKESFKVPLDKPLGELQDGEAVKFSAPKDSGFLMQGGGGDNYPGKIAFAGYAVKAGEKVLVFATTCSHLGCSIAINTGGKRFDCPCHGSQFSLSGQVTHGPAAAPLSTLNWKEGEKPQEIIIEGVTVPGIG